MDDTASFLEKLRYNIKYALPWLDKGSVKPIIIEPSANVGSQLTTTTNGTQWSSPTGTGLTAVSDNSGTRWVRVAEQQDLDDLRIEFESFTAPGMIPIGGILDFYGSAIPPRFMLCDGSAIPSGLTLAIAVIGANVPDLRGRVTAGLDTMGGSDAGRISITDSIGQTGGAESKSITHTLAAPSHTHTFSGTTSNDNTFAATQSGTGVNRANASHTHSYSGTTSGASATALTGSIDNVNVVQPTMLVNKIIRVI